MRIRPYSNIVEQDSNQILIDNYSDIKEFYTNGNEMGDEVMSYLLQATLCSLTMKIMVN